MNPYERNQHMNWDRFNDDNGRAGVDYDDDDWNGECEYCNGRGSWYEYGETVYCPMCYGTGDAID